MSPGEKEGEADPDSTKDGLGEAEAKSEDKQRGRLGRPWVPKTWRRNKTGRWGRWHSMLSDRGQQIFLQRARLNTMGSARHHVTVRTT